MVASRMDQEGPRNLGNFRWDVLFLRYYLDAMMNTILPRATSQVFFAIVEPK